MKLSGASLEKVDRTSPLYLSLLSAHQRLAQKDATTWGAKASAEAAIRLNWVDLPQSSQPLLSEISSLASRYAHLKKIVLCGMGGSSLGPEVIAKTFQREIFILDSTDPHYLNRVAGSSLADTLVLVSSKSGSTIETSSQRAFFEARFTELNLNPVDHIIFVTDPGSPLDHDVRAKGFTVINADPNVGGRFSVLSAFGLVPATFMGAPAAEILASASQEKNSIISDCSSVVDCAYLFFTATEQYITFTDANSAVPGLSDWIEQLIAESTGKDGKGRLPIAVQERTELRNVFHVAFGGSNADLIVEGPLGAHFIFWEWVTALLGFALSIDPFNQPNVTEAKEQTAQCLVEWNNALPLFQSNYSEKSVAVFGDGQNLHDALATFIEGVADGGYIAIMAYMDRRDDAALIELQSILTKKAARPTSFGWGPRFLHSTGQFHKGGQKNGSFLQITSDSAIDFDIPGKPYSFHTLLMAQAIGDNRAISARKYPLLRLHLANRSAGIDEILAAARKL